MYKIKKVAQQTKNKKRKINKKSENDKEVNDFIVFYSFFFNYNINYNYLNRIFRHDITCSMFILFFY